MAYSPFTTPGEEQIVTRNFLCYLYWESRNRPAVHENGMIPRDIYDGLEMEAVTGEDLKNQRVERLVTNNLNSHYITLNGNTGRAKMTDTGNNYCYSNCGGAPTPD